MDGRRDDGYAVRYRLAAPRTLRGSLGLAAVGVVVAAWLAATLLTPRPSSIADADRTSSPGTSASEAQVIRPSLPPPIERQVPIGDPTIPTVGLAGLGWLDTQQGSVRFADDGTEPRWLFLEADRSTLCVCLRRVAGALPQYEVRTYGPPGQLVASLTVADWPSTFAERTVTDVVREPTNRFLYVAWAREIADEHWRLGLDLVSREDGSTRTTTLAEVATVHTLGAPVDVRIWLAPDGRHVRIRFATIDGLQLGAPADEGWWAWNVSVGGSTPGDAVQIRERSMSKGTGCFAEGWATPRDFVVACQGPAEASSDVVTVRATSIDGEVTQRELPRGDEAPAWLINQTTGQLFIWAPMDRHIWRVDVPSLTVVEQEFSRTDIDRGLATWPLPGEDGVAWLPRGWQQRPPWLDERLLVGSRDGTLVFAAGSQPSGSDRDELDSTGVWAIDAQSLALVAHWTPVGDYSALALTPSGDQVIAAGGPTPEELMAFGSHGATIAFHDASGKGISLILRGVTDWPTFLVAEPPPEPT